MGWVNSEFRCCRGIESRDNPGLTEGNRTNTAQSALVSNEDIRGVGWGGGDGVGWGGGHGVVWGPDIFWSDFGF